MRDNSLLQADQTFLLETICGDISFFIVVITGIAGGIAKDWLAVVLQF